MTPETRKKVKQMSEMEVEITYTVDGLDSIEEIEDRLYEALDVGLDEYADLIHSDEQEMTYHLVVVVEGSFKSKMTEVQNKLKEEIEIGDDLDDVTVALGNVQFRSMNVQCKKCQSFHWDHHDWCISCGYGHEDDSMGMYDWSEVVE